MLNYLRNRRFVADEATRLVATLDAMKAAGKGRLGPSQAEQALARTAAAVGARSLGWVAQSVLANQVRWALTDRGYPAEWVTWLTERLVLECATAVTRTGREQESELPGA